MGYLLKLGVLGLAGYYGATQCLLNVKEGHEAIVISCIDGVKDKVYPEGTHFIIPWIEKVVIYDVHTWPFPWMDSYESLDLQMLQVLYHPEIDKLPTIHRTLGEQLGMVLYSIVNETLKVVAARYNTMELVTLEEALEEEIWKVLSKKAANFNIIMDGVSILHLEVESKSTDVTEATTVAALEAETKRPKFDEENAEQEKEAGA